MATLTDKEIKELVEKEGILFNPDTFNEECCKGSFYDLRIGKTAHSLTYGKDIDLTKEKLRVRPQEWVNISTEEFLIFDNGKEGDARSSIYCGRIYSKVGLISAGLSHISTTVDPGFRGNLRICVCNHGNKPIILERGKPLCKLEIEKLNVPPKRLYGRDYGHLQKPGAQLPKLANTDESWRPISPDKVTTQALEGAAYIYGEPYDTIIGMTLRLNSRLERIEDSKIEDFSGRLSSLEEWRNHAKFRTSVITPIIAAIIGGVIGLVGGYFMRFIG